jgi:nitroreductase / dihydropteridine reductase
MPETDSLALWARRAAIKKFDPAHPVSDSDWEAILRAIEQAPSAYGLQPYRVLEVRDPALRSAIHAATPSQNQLKDADRLLIFSLVTDFGEAHVDAHLGRTGAARGTPPDSLALYRARVVGELLNKLDRTALLAWQARQAYIGLGAAMFQASQLGIDTCPLEAISLSAVDGVLGLPGRNLTSLVGLAVGYRSEEDVYSKQPKVRLPREEFVLEF